MTSKKSPKGVGGKLGLLGALLLAISGFLLPAAAGASSQGTTTAVVTGALDCSNVLGASGNGGSPLLLSLSSGSNSSQITFPRSIQVGSIFGSPQDEQYRFKVSIPAGEKAATIHWTLTCQDKDGNVAGSNGGTFSLARSFSSAHPATRDICNHGGRDGITLSTCNPPLTTKLGKCSFALLTAGLDSKVVEVLTNVNDPLKTTRQIATLELEEVSGPLGGIIVGCAPLVSGSTTATTVASGTGAQPSSPDLSWSAPQQVDDNGGLSAVSCSSPSFCGAVSSASDAYIYANGAWTSSELIGVGDVGANLTSISCPKDGYCVATGDYDTYTYSHGAWTNGLFVQDDNYFTSISCASASDCVAVDNGGNAFTFNGSSWSAPDAIDPNNALTSVSCASASFCVAVALDGNVFTYDGSTWSAPDAVDPGYKLHSVSCPSASFCAVGAAVNVFTFNGTSWSAPDSIDESNNDTGTSSFGLPSMSCPSSSFCATLDGSGNVFSFNGTSWSSPDSIDPTTELTSVSCPTASFCLAVDNSGNALTLGSGSPVKQVETAAPKAKSATVKTKTATPKTTTTPPRSGLSIDLGTGATCAEYLRANESSQTAYVHTFVSEVAINQNDVNYWVPELRIVCDSGEVPAGSINQYLVDLGDLGPGQ